MLYLLDAFSIQAIHLAPPGIRKSVKSKTTYACVAAANAVRSGELKLSDETLNYFETNPGIQVRCLFP